MCVLNDVYISGRPWPTAKTALVVGRIKDELIDTLDFRKKLEIAISDMQYNIASVLSESETERKQKKVRRNKARFHCLFAFRKIPNTKN